ncbi:MAG: YfhO family protein [Anaerolineae bacterium]|nr:YfhO family protein [Anaerolineae bacterium]
MQRFRRIVRATGPYLLLASILLLFFWPVWLLGATFPIGGGDLFGQLLPVWQYVSRFVQRGVLPFWSTQMMAGDPIVGEPQYGLFNPLNWWLFIVGTEPRGLVLARGMLPLLLAGAGVYTYLRRSHVWCLHRDAALIGATAYMLSDPFITHLGHPQMNDAMAWLPWSLLAVDKLLERRQFLVWPSIVFAAVILTGHYQSALLTATATGLYVVWRLLSDKTVRQPEAHRSPSRSRPLLWHAGRLGLSALCAAGLAMPAVLPGLERYPFTERAILQLEPWRGYQWPLAMAVDLIAPGFHGRGIAGFWAPWARVEGAYAGATAAFLAILGLLAILRRRRTWFLLLLGAFGLLYALGYDGPLYPWLARVDLIARMGKTARAIFLLSFALSLAAAAGVDALRYARIRLRIAWTVLIATGAVILMFGTPMWISGMPGDRRPNAASSLYTAAGAGMALIALLWMQRARKLPVALRSMARAGVLVMLVAELILSGTWVELEFPGQNPAQAAIDYLKSDPNWFRVDVDSDARGLLSPSVLLASGFEVPQGSGNPMELFSYTQFYWAVPYKGAPVYQLLGAKYIIVPKGALPGGDGIWPVFTEAPSVDVHLNTNALQRIWLVYDTLPVNNIEEANAVVFSPDFAPVHLATVENGPDLDGAGTGSLEVVAYGGNRVEVIVRTSAPALLVLSDMRYPGWRATVDGDAVEIYKTNGIFRGIVVPEGEHRVTMRYRPASVRLGLGLVTMAALVLAAARAGRAFGHLASRRRWAVR